MTVHLEVSTENLLNAVAQMPESEFNRFVERARALRKNGEKKQSVSPAEADLLHKINTIFPPEKRRRFNELYARFKNNDLNDDEYKEALALNDDIEALNAERIKLIGELAQLRGQTLEEVMDFFELGNSKDGE
jgi:hypothetical protein